MRSKDEVSIFGRRSVPHTIVLARGDKVRHWTIRPWLLVAATSFVGCIAIGGVGAGATYMLSDGIISALIAREARNTNAYEERIAGMRTEIDRLLTGQTKVQETVGRQVSDLLTQQAELTERLNQLQPLLRKAQGVGILQAEDLAAPLPSPVPTRLQMPVAQPSGASPLRGTADLGRPHDAPDGMEKLSTQVIPSIRESVSEIANEQASTLAELTRTTLFKTDRISEVLTSLGVEVGPDAGAVGGPYIPVESDKSFEESLGELDAALSAFDKLRQTSKSLPLADPMPGAQTTSTFGVRLDPFFKRTALHSGVDFAAPAGSAVKSTAAGVVVSAGEAGGYGLMIEVDHGNGYSSRYAHLSRIEVSKGEKVFLGDVIGRVGSTGRSTGSHLHYEVRQQEVAVDPARYIRAGHRLASL